jgi:hypothetical protein
MHSPGSDTAAYPQTFTVHQANAHDAAMILVNRRIEEDG